MTKVLSTIMVLLSLNHCAIKTSMYCEEDKHLLNGCFGDINVVRTGSFFSGAPVSMRNVQEYSCTGERGLDLDIKYKFRYCGASANSNVFGPFNGDRSVTLPQTPMKTDWYSGCEMVNGGHAAIHSIISHYDREGNKEIGDRQWTFSCGLLDPSVHRLGNCKFAKNQVEQGLFGFLLSQARCPNNGVIRGIQTYWSVYKDDVHGDLWPSRDFYAECCTVFDTSYTFEDLEGEWVKLQSCDGCSSIEYWKQTGTSTTVTTTFTQSYTDSLSKSVSAGFEFDIGLKTSATITGTQAETVSNGMSNAFTHSVVETSKFVCEHMYMYQWVMRGSNTRDDGLTGVFESYSSDYLCTDTSTPQCPPGYCKPNTGCQECIDANSANLNYAASTYPYTF